jgi:hypothetical protein
MTVAQRIIRSNWIARPRAHATARFRRLTYGRRRFRLGDRAYHYLCHPAGWSWTTERAVEVPIVMAALASHPDARLLEVGNVLRSYVEHRGDVVDLHEVAPGVANEDIVDFSAPPYDLIVSISTLEHVGWDEPELEPDKASRAFRHLADLLSPGGALLVTIPLGYHRFLDRDLFHGRLPVDEVRYLRRMTRSNLWSEVDETAAWGSTYEFPYRGGNTIAVCTRGAPLAHQPIG